MLTETQKDISLVEYALKKHGYLRDEYVLSYDEVATLPAGHAEAGVGLARYQGKWAVYIYDRANRNQIAMHDTIYSAITDFYWRCINTPTQYDYRTEWEKETGLEFDLNNVVY